VLVYPLMVPALLGAIQLSSLLVAGEPLGADNQIWFRLLIAFDVIYTALALYLIEIVLVG
jgi:ABC-type transport system involved in cytochrome c biogenesis permease component